MTLQATRLRKDVEQAKAEQLANGATLAPHALASLGIALRSDSQPITKAFSGLSQITLVDPPILASTARLGGQDGQSLCTGPCLRRVTGVFTVQDRADTDRISTIDLKHGHQVRNRLRKGTKGDRPVSAPPRVNQRNSQTTGHHSVHLPSSVGKARVGWEQLLTLPCLPRIPS